MRNVNLFAFPLVLNFRQEVFYARCCRNFTRPWPRHVSGLPGHFGSHTAPTLATLAALFACNSPLLGLYTQVFMKATGGFIVAYFPLFMLGALFGNLMDDSGAAQAIALSIVKKLGTKHAILAIIPSCFLGSVN